MTNKIVFARTRAVPPWGCEDIDSTNLSLAHTAVLLLMAREPETPRYGHELSRLTGYGTATIYAALDRFHQRGWLGQLAQDVTGELRSIPGPPRTYYVLTRHGLTQVSAVREYVRALGELNRHRGEWDAE